MSKEIDWNDPVLKLPCPTPRAFYHNIRLPDPLVEQVTNIGGDNLIAAWGYGSAFSGTGRKTSQLDFMLVVKDTLAFHRRNIVNRRSDYQCLVSPRCQYYLNRLGMNFYDSKINLPQAIEGEMRFTDREIKYGVIGFNTFLTHARGGRLDTHQSGEGKGHLYLAGRLQKPNLVPIMLPDGGMRDRLDMAVNQTRIDGIWLAMGFLPDRFTYSQLCETYTRLSYMADSRIENPNKVQDLLKNNQVPYGLMFAPLLEQFQQEGIVQKDGEHFVKNVSLKESDVKEWLSSCRGYARIINYGKNPLSFGVCNGLKYSLSKILRVWGSR